MKQQSGSEALQSPSQNVASEQDLFKLLISPGTDCDSTPGLIQAVFMANKYRLRYARVIYRLRHGCVRNDVSQAIVVRLRYGGYEHTEYGSV